MANVRNTKMQSLLPVAITVGAVGVRWLLVPLIGDANSWSPLYAGVVLSAWWSGFRAGALSSIGALIAVHWLPRDLPMPSASTLVSAAFRDGLFLFTCLGVIAPLEAMRRSMVKLKIELDARTAELRAVDGDREAQAAQITDLQASDRHNSEFLTTLSHELRNLLAPVGYGLEAQKHAKGDLKVLEQSREVMNRQFQRMSRLVDDILDVSRLGRGALSLRMCCTSIQHVLRQSIDTSRPFLESRKHKLTVRLPTAPLYLIGDETRLVQVFTNILNNAAKYTPPRGRIDLKAALEGDQIAIRIRDNGIGIPQTMLDSIFTLFVRVDSSRTVNDGLGIGLTLVKKLVQLHGGTVQAESAGHYKGSKFIVHLPVAEHVPTNSPAKRQTPSAAYHRMLVVDDNEDIANSSALMLRLRGHEVETALSGLEALEKGQRYRPDVVLLDIGMNGLNGHETAQLIRERPWGREIILVAVTGWAQTKDKIDSIGAGCDFHYVKPLEPEFLERMLDDLTYQKSRKGDAT